MNKSNTYTLGYSSCPNDTFIFKAVARQLIDLSPFSFDIRIEDVETLNQQAVSGTLDITKLSFAALGNLLDKYALLRSGSALGNGCGPLLIARDDKSPDVIPKPVVAVPGLGTTAYLLFRFFLADAFPGKKVTVVPMPFEKIMPAVVEKKTDYGVIIHEGRFVYESFGLHCLMDLGQWWEDHTGLPIPLGCIAVRREIPKETAGALQSLIRQSIDHAFAHPYEASGYIREHAQELDNTVIQQHIGLYVNDFSKDLGQKGEAAIRSFFEKGRQSGLIQPSSQPLFAC